MGRFDDTGRICSPVSDLRVMNMALCILVADRNRHVRDFIRRELSIDRHKVFEAGTIRELLGLISQKSCFDLIIFDPCFPGLEDPQQLQRVMDQVKPAPVIIHTCLNSLEGLRLEDPRVSLLEKSGNSIERIKQLILKMQH